MLALRDLQLRYRQTLFGVAWAVLQPLAAVVSSPGSSASSPGSRATAFPIRSSSSPGVVPWFFISTAVSAAAESLVEHPDLVTKVWFPRMLAPIAAVLAGPVDLLIGLLLLVR